MARRFIFALSCFLTATAAFNVSTLTFDEGYAPLFGDGNVVKSADGKSVSLMLDRNSGSGFISSELYSHGFFSAKIKLPSDYTAGVVVAFYTSNGDIFEKTHDELDFEFLGNIRGKEWRVQTNVYGDGSTNIGREERYLLPFDPTKEAHRYSILWTAENIIFYIDQTPIREIRRTAAMGSHYPSKPMSLYATIWDASSWATNGGKYGVDYSYAPFVAEFSDLALAGCATGPIQDAPSREACESAHTELSTADFAVMTPAKRAAMRRFRERYMTYSICYDEVRYPVKLPDCEVVPSEQRRFWHTGDARFQRVHRRRQGRSRAAVVAKGGADEDV